MCADVHGKSVRVALVIGAWRASSGKSSAGGAYDLRRPPSLLREGAMLTRTRHPRNRMIVPLVSFFTRVNARRFLGLLQLGVNLTVAKGGHLTGNKN